MTDEPSIAFGDRVRVRAGPATDAAGVGGRIGRVYGHTTPSVTKVQVLGDTGKDFAISVQLDGDNSPFWVDPGLLELVDHAPGTEIGIGGKRFVRTPSGDWSEVGERGLLARLRRSLIGK